MKKQLDLHLLIKVSEFEKFILPVMLDKEKLNMRPKIDFDFSKISYANGQIGLLALFKDKIIVSRLNKIFYEKQINIERL